MNKRICVLSGSRTGSSLMQFILWRYIRGKWDNYHQPLGEIFMRSWMYDTGSSIATLRLTHLTEQASQEILIDLTFEYNRRIDLLKKYHHHLYFMKFSSVVWTYASRSHLQYLYDNYHFIVVDRRNKRERALSYAISLNSNFFTLRHKKDIQKFIIGEFTQKMGDLIVHDFNSLARAKKMVLVPEITSTEVWYEDFENLENKFEILGTLGFHDWEKYIKPTDHDELPYKVGNMIDKESYITNIDFFNDWFQQNFGDE